MHRRTFLRLGGTAGLVSAAGLAAASTEAGSGRQYMELQKYSLDTEAQRQALDTFLKDVALPALNRLGIRPVGVFCDAKDFSPVYVLLPHRTAESALTLTQRLLADAEFAAKGAAFIDAPKEALPYREVESWLTRAFKGMPRVDTPVTAPGRIFQLRIYESPSLKTGQKKIEMFNDAGEIDIFRRVGLNPVFFGETLVGGKMPNLTYMLMFESEGAMKAGWKKFGGDPDWQRLRGMDEYADRNILSGITNLLLKPAEYSQI